MPTSPVLILHHRSHSANLPTSILNRDENTGIRTVERCNSCCIGWRIDCMHIVDWRTASAKVFLLLLLRFFFSLFFLWRHLYDIVPWLSLQFRHFLLVRSSVTVSTWECAAFWAHQVRRRAWLASVAIADPAQILGRYWKGKGIYPGLQAIICHILCGENDFKVLELGKLNRSVRGTLFLF